MRFLSIFKTVERTTPPSVELVSRMQQLIEESMKSGELVATEGCLPSATGARVRRDAGTITVTDGPFTEAKELIGGFALLEAGSKEEAIAIAKKFLAVAGEGECEIRQLCNTPASAAVDAASQQAHLAGEFAKI